MTTKEYLGDSVYCDVWSCGDLEHGLVLTTENEMRLPSNKIVLEPEVIAALERYVATMRKNGVMR